MRRYVVPILLAIGLLTGCGGSAPTGFSDTVIDEWLGVCMEGPPYEVYCRCYAAAVAPVDSEEDFLANMREPISHLSSEGLDAAERECSDSEPILRPDGIAGVAFGTSTDEALNDLLEIFGEAEIASPSECSGATVASWASLQAVFAEGTFSGWAYGAAGPADEFESLGLHAEVSMGNVISFLYPFDSLEALRGRLEGSLIVDESGPTTLVVTDAAGTDLRAVAVGDSAVRLESGTTCDSGP
ncbi:hypothetical protein HQ535_06000 [bacterium]|nr:hypothetical protein [bacterium]